MQNSQGTLLHLSRYEYDHNGNRTLVQVGDQITRTAYNSQNQPITITNSLGHQTHITYDTNFTNTYGQRVLQTTLTDPMGTLTIDTYDTANRLVETTRLNPFGLKVGRKTNHYDLCGNLRRIEEEVIQEGNVKKLIRTLFDYNEVNQITKMIEAATTPEQKITRTHYNSLWSKGFPNKTRRIKALL